MADKDKSPRAKSTNPTTPEDYTTVSSSSGLPSGDYSYTLEVVMGLQATIGQLKEAVDTLKSQSKTHGEKLDRISHIFYGATAVVTVIGGIGLFILNKLWDLGLAYFKPH